MIGIQHGGSPETLWVTADHRVLCQRPQAAEGEQPSWCRVPDGHFERARQLRRDMTQPERRLWEVLRRHGAGVKFRRQHPIGPYIVDFYAREPGLVVEVDGDNHFTPGGQESDRERDAYLAALGLSVLRFANLEVRHNLETVAAVIEDAVGGVRAGSAHRQEWRRADALHVGDVVYIGGDMRPVPIINLVQEETEEQVADLEVEGAHAYLTEVCAVHNCGSGTTAYVAEQWGRRWITIDTSRVALTLARTRLMSARFPYYLLADSAEGMLREGGSVRSDTAHASSEYRPRPQKGASSIAGCRTLL